MTRDRVLRVALVLAVLAAAGFLLRGYTTDDTYIHLRYAKHLASAASCRSIRAIPPTAARARSGCSGWRRC